MHRQEVARLEGAVLFYDTFLQKHNRPLSLAEMVNLLTFAQANMRPQPDSESRLALPAGVAAATDDPFAATDDPFAAHGSQLVMKGSHQPNGEPRPAPPVRMAAANADPSAARRAQPGMNGGHHQHQADMAYRLARF
ncbi:hypothetical protein BZA05DRAFT_448119 [Tricharina praecox]|uniref:uncharacterized protein n=1 Tax=Tricharina praecox TaxID=43433 RepID=UPI00222125A7|nr:uncharacterized protein BZA05DRAFT_448119 [Tricharina praecox]KAI5844913.1 hypothetical protein BZA05DRAFT_448119 [Tricharina praecox]